MCFSLGFGGWREGWICWSGAIPRAWPWQTVMPRRLLKGRSDDHSVWGSGKDTAGAQGMCFCDLGLRKQGPICKAVLGVWPGMEAYFLDSRQLIVRTC